QTLGDEVYVPENARHRVSRYKRDGEMIASFGSHDRKRADGFGGCCEPKNLCFDAQGNILAAESGTPVLIKRFSPAGEFIEVVARPVFTTGCVRVTIGMDHASGRVYMLEGRENKIHAFGDPREVPTHQQVAILSATGEESSGRIATLCTAAGGNLLVACNGASGGEIRVINPEGEMVDTWKLDFAPQAINTSADGTVFVGGGGQIAKLDAQGKVLATADSPAVEALMPNPEDFLSGGPESAQAKAKVLAQRVASMEKSLDEDRLAQQRAMYDRLIAQYKEKGDTQRAEVYTQAKAQIKERMLASVNRYREQLAEAEAAAKEEAKQQESMTPEQREAAMKEAVEKAREVARQRATVTGIAVGGKDVFISCRGRSGYTVYRTDPSLGNSVKIVDRLSGCCGQMDIQAHQGDLWVAANTRGQVIRYDRNGKRLASWGKLDRKSVEGFGSCCNPMNIRFGSDGMVYTSEASLGRIKRFTLDGEFLGVVGTAKIVPGCKHAPIGISPDGDRVYLLDITRSHIVTLAKDAPDAEKVASRESTERVEE
ncbi:MAG: hypothetical protein HQ581_16840, partial [Planctomycetes bacterium]|nr:hypothetical protein [Planctomycetota bacterium]